MYVVGIRVTHATVAVDALFLEVLRFGGSRPPPELIWNRKNKRLPDKKSHGLGMQQEFLKTKLQNSDDCGSRSAPPFRNRFRQKVIPLSSHASYGAVMVRLWYGYGTVMNG